jgi:hypothetical protein
MMRTLSAAILLAGSILAAPAWAGQAPSSADAPDIPVSSHVLALATEPNGSGMIKPLSAFTTNLAGSAIVNAIAPIRQIVQNRARPARCHLVIGPGTLDKLGTPGQIQARG